jgi:predicted nucleotidyltransferase
MTTNSGRIHPVSGPEDALGLKHDTLLAANEAPFHGCDPKARAVALAVYEAVQPRMVILFGSRARGDYHDDSDIDLLVITGEEPAGNDGFVQATRSAHRKADAVYGYPIGVDVLHLTDAEFADRRRARNHVAGQAVRDGVDQNGERLNDRYEGEERDNRPDIRQRIANAERELRTLKILIENDADQETIGFHVQQALENALKGWISALDGEYRNTHDIGNLAAIVRGFPAEGDTPAGEQLDWLTKYAVEYRYEGARMSMTDRFELPSVVHDTVAAILGRTLELSGRE